MTDPNHSPLLSGYNTLTAGVNPSSFQAGGHPAPPPPHHLHPSATSVDPYPTDPESYSMVSRIVVDMTFL